MEFTLELLPNGLIRIVHRASGLSALYTLAGIYRSGDLHCEQSALAVKKFIEDRQ